MNVLPGVITPGANAVSFEPAPHRARRDGRKAGVLAHTTSQFSSTEAARATPGTAWASYRRELCLARAPEGEKRLGAPLRGASAREWVLAHRPRQDPSLPPISASTVG